MCAESSAPSTWVRRSRSAAGPGARETTAGGRSGTPAVRDRRPDRGLRGPAAPLPVPRPAPPRDDEGPGAPGSHQRDHPTGDGVARLPGGRDPTPDAEHPRGRARLPRPEPVVAGHVLRAPTVAAAAEATADGWRAGSLLPDRAVPARRAAPCRPELRG